MLTGCIGIDTGLPGFLGHNERLADLGGTVCRFTNGDAVW